MNKRIITHILGLVLLFEAAALSLPFACSLLYRDGMWGIFLGCIGICLLLGLLLRWKTPANKKIYSKEGYTIVALSWIVMSVFGALPFVISGYIPGIVDAFFETVSGFTTTGASIITDIDVFPKSLIFWHSFTHWIGGMGVIVFLVAVLPMSGGRNLYLLKAESPGPSVSKLVPKIKSTAWILYKIYIALTLLEVVFLLFGGLELFDSLTISFGTAGTGGFSITNGGMGIYSPYIRVVVTVFMIMFGIDFSVFYLLIIGKAASAFRSEEVKVYLGVILVSIAVIAFNCRGLFGSLAETLRQSAFQVAAMITTTGYSTADFDAWPELSKTILVALMFMGACAGSTGGGIKVSRIMILLKSIKKEAKIAAHPKTVYKIQMNGRPLEHETQRAVNVFIVTYLVVFAISLLIISLDNFDFTTNFTAVLASINNIGPGLGGVGPMRNFAGFSNLSTIVLSFDMLIGRLEIFPIMVLLSPYTWKK